METNALRKNKNLCCKLEMDFNEVNELFGGETLSSMQMVQVNGGLPTPVPLPYIGPMITTIAALLSIYISIKQITGNTPDPSEEIKVDADPAKGSLVVTLPSNRTGSVTIDSLTMTSSNGSSFTVVGFKITAGDPSPSGPTQSH